MKEGFVVSNGRDLSTFKNRWDNTSQSDLQIQGNSSQNLRVLFCGNGQGDPKIHVERIVFSTTGSGTTGFLHVKEKSWMPTSHHTHRMDPRFKGRN